MPDPEVPATPEVAAPEPAAAAPTFTEELRSEFGKEDDTPAPAAAGANEKIEVKEALEDALPELTDAQIAKLSEDPRVVRGVLDGTAGKQTLDELFREVMADTETKVVTKIEREAVQKQVSATAAEALKAYEEGDPEPLAKFTYEQAKRQQETNVTTEAEGKIRDAAKGEVIGSLDEAVELVYGDVMDKITDADMATIARKPGQSDKDFMAGVLKLFDTKRAEAVRLGAAGDLQSEAEKTAAAARGAREVVGVGALPSGSGVETIGDSLGDLIRKGMEGAPGLDGDD